MQANAAVRPKGGAPPLVDPRTASEELAELRREVHRLRAGRRWLAVPLLLLGTWTLSAQAPATSPDIEKRLSELEARVRRGAGNATQISAPFDVVDAGGKVILRVSDRPATTGAVAIYARSFGGVVVVHSSSGKSVMGMGADDGGAGTLWATDVQGTPRAEIHGSGGIVLRDRSGIQIAGMTDHDGRGRLGIWSTDKTVAELTSAADGGAGELRIMDGSGATTLAELTAGSGGDIGELRVMNGGKPTAAVLGGVRGSGAVLVGNAAGKTYAEMSVSDDQRGLFQVFGEAGTPVAVMTQRQRGAGGLLQISSPKGTPVTALTTGSSGAGYLQLTDPAGTPTIELGTLPSGAGMVRAGPLYKCAPIHAATPGMGFGLPDCIVGALK